MRLRDFLNVFIDEHATGIGENTVLCFYKPAITRFEKYLKHEASFEDLNDATINSWTKAELLKEGNLTTLAKRRSAILALWRAAYLSHRIESEPRRIRKLPKNTRVVEAWTRDELLKLLETIETSDWSEKTMPKSVLNKADFFHTLASVAYETGLRLGDLLDMERGWIRTDSTGTGFVTKVIPRKQISLGPMLSDSFSGAIDSTWHGVVSI